MALCRECSRIGTSKAGAREFADDVMQDMALHVLGRFIDVYDAERDPRPYLIEVARRLGLGYLRRHSKEVIYGKQDDAYDPFDALLAEDMEVERRLEQDEADMRALQAKETLLARMRERAAGKPAPAVPSPPEAPVVRPRPSRPPDMHADPVRQRRRQRPEVREIERIRRRIGYTHEQLAAAIDMAPSAIRTLCYGAVDGDPEEILRRVRGVEATHGVFDATVPIGQRLIEWCEKLGINHGEQDDWPSRLTEEIGVHRSTMFRWRSRNVQPAPHIMRAMDALVDALAQSKREKKA